MSRTTRIGLGTAAALGVLGAVEILLWMAVRAQWQIVQAPGPASLAEALTQVIVAVAAVLGAWLVVSTLAAMLAHLPGRLGVVADRWAGAWAPAISRRVAAVLVGAALGGALAPGTALGDGPAVPAAAGLGLTPGFTATAAQGDAAEAVTPAPADAAQRRDSASAPGWTPSRPTQRPQPAPGLVTSGSESRRAAYVVVHGGDTLWDLARRHLGPDATDAEVAHAWPAWYAANRAVIGDDPDLILPGQILRPPSPAASAHVSPQASPTGAGR